MRDFNAESTFRMRLRQRRSARGWSQALLAEKVSKFFGDPIDQTTIARIEKGTRKISLNDAFRLATIFGLAIEDLLAGIDCPACEDFPPPGYACQTCGATREGV